MPRSECFLKPMISVVVPTLYCSHLPRTIEALKNQTYNQDLVEIIVVGRNHPDRIRSDSQVKFIETPRAEPPAVSRNIGLRYARGEIVCFIDDDCEAHPRWVEMLAATHARPNTGVVGGAIAFPSDRYWARCDALAGAFEQLEFQDSGVRRHLASMNLSARKQVLCQVGGFDETYPFAAGEDAELCLRLRKLGYQIHFEPRALIYHLGWRNTFPTAWRHINVYGQYSPWLNKTHKKIVKPPFFFKHWVIMLLLCPMLAGWISMRMFLRSSVPRDYPHLLPGVYLLELAWCAGVIKRLYNQNPIKKTGK